MISTATTDRKIQCFTEALPSPIWEVMKGVVAIHRFDDTIKIYCPSEPLGEMLFWGACGHLARGARVAGLRYVQVWAAGAMLHELSPQSGTIIENFYLSESREKLTEALQSKASKP